MDEPTRFHRSNDLGAVRRAVSTWYEANARELPWRAADATAWQVMTSEVMLQQTPVERVRPVYEAWVERWPTPAALAAEASGEAVRAWGRLGYPRRALRLHAAAAAITAAHGGRVPESVDALRALPGVGEYTAAAVAAFAYGRRHAVLDTNVRRVLGRVVLGRQYPGTSVSADERRLAEALLPESGREAARWSVAVMELGALVCTARSPACAVCPISTACGWRLAGYPAHQGPPRRGQRYEGTDRQCRGQLLGVLRDTDDAVAHRSLVAVWGDDQQRERALDGLVADGLVEVLRDGTYRLPG